MNAYTTVIKFQIHDIVHQVESPSLGPGPLTGYHTCRNDGIILLKEFRLKKIRATGKIKKRTEEPQQLA